MEGLVLPDFFVRAPVVSYFDPRGHRIKLHYDLTESGEYKVDEFGYVTTDEKEETFIYCGQCRKYYPLSKVVIKYPKNPRGRGFLHGAGLARAYDEAVQKDRIVRMLVIGGMTQTEVALALGLSRPRVSQVAAEVAHMLRGPQLDEGEPTDVDLRAVVE